MDIVQKITDSLVNERHYTMAESTYWCGQFKQIGVEARKEIQQLRAKVDELEKDANRLAWLHSINKDEYGWQQASTPSWCSHMEYRIKPEPVYEWQWLCRAPDGLFFTSAFFTCPPAYTYKCIEESKREVR